MIKDIISQNEHTNANDFTLRKLHADFPQCFDKDGKFNMERFKKLVSDNVEVTRESYELNFLGKNYAHLIASTETETVIQPDVENNNKPENKDSQNVYISGDNIDALKHLLKSYSGKIKCIYIDPPYNTGSDGFVYNDKFGFTSEQLQVKLDIDEDRANRILDLCKRGSASHSAWLTYMSPRLMLAKDLLTDDGVIFISIDDNEQANLKILCDGIFGEENFVNNFAWINNITGRQISGKGAAKTWESILCYAKNVEYIDLFNIDIKFAKKMLPDTYKGFAKDIRKDDNGSYAIGDTLYNHNRKFNEETRPNLVFSIFYNPETKEILTGEINDKIQGFVEIPPHANGDGSHKYHAWRWSREKIKNEHYNLIVLPNKNGYEIYTRQRDFDTTTLKDLITNISNGDDELKLLFDGKKCFEYPKSTALLQTLISKISYSDIIIDFFSGSATTAHAVMQLNAEDGGDRKYIMVQLQEETPANSEARKAGYNTIDEIGQERIRRAAAKIRKEHPDYNGDLGFKHYILKDVPQDTLDKMEHFDPNNTEMFSDTDILQAFGKDTVLETWCVRDGYGLNAPVKELKLENYTAYYCGNHLYFIDGEGFDENAMAALIDEYNKEASFSPQNIILFGYNFTFIQTEMIKRNITILDLMNKPVIFDIRY